MKEKPFEYSNEQVLAGLTEKGTGRAFLITGKDRSWQKEELERICSRVSQREKEAFWTIIDAGKSRSVKDWCAQFARNLRTTSGTKPELLAKFALEVGKSSQGTGISKEDTRTEVKPDGLVKALTSEFAKLVQGSPKILLCIRGLDQLSSEILNWMSNDLNKVLRKTPVFSNTRFLFTSEECEDIFKSFFDQFGFEKVRYFKFVPDEDLKPQVDINPSVNTTHSENYDSNESKRLINKKLSSKLGDNFMLEEDSISKYNSYLDSLSSEEKAHLFLASYPSKISRYSLEHFTDARTAALCYNWLKRQKSLTTEDNEGALILVTELRQFLQFTHSETDPSLSSKWGEISSVLNIFFNTFPFQADHFVAINLQIFAYYTDHLLKSLFNVDELNDIKTFMSRNESLIHEHDTGFSLTDDAKLIIRRYMEISEKKPIDGLSDRVEELWTHDNIAFGKKHSRMDEEKQNLTDDIKNALSQVSQLKELKDTLLENFRNPKRLRPKKSYSFTTSRSLLLIGLGTVAASLLSENIGSYHAACGLALTFLGFFWPNVELKTETAGGVGANSSLAIETQQRSLSHRITSLCNRVEVMNKNLNDVEISLKKLGDVPPLPYLESIEEEKSNTEA